MTPRSKTELLFILSPSFSGSTLLTFLLAAHPNVATVGELKASALGEIATYRCSCGALLQQCGFWKTVRQEMQQRGAPLSFEDFGTHFNRGPWLFRHVISLTVANPVAAALSEWALRIFPPWRRRRNKIIDRNWLLMKLITTNQHGRLFVDGSKDPERLRQFLNSHRWNIKVIRLLRDGRGIVNSYMRHYHVDMKSATIEWLRTERICARVMSSVPVQDTFIIKYEDICREPQATLNRICAFVGLDSAFLQERFSMSKLHIMGNAMRLEIDKSIKIDERWKNQLHPRELDLFEAIAGECNRKRGYI